MADNTYNHNNILGKKTYPIPNGKESKSLKDNASNGQTLSERKNKSSADSSPDKSYTDSSEGKPSAESLKRRLQVDTKSKTAIALSYNPMDNAPRIIASGKGHLADKIMKTAGELNIPIHKDAQLAGTLSKLEIGDAIPPELYEIVADILVFVDQMDRIKSKVLPKKE